MFPALRQSPLLSLLKRTPPILPKFKSSKTISTFQRFPIRLAPQSILLSVHATRSFHSNSPRSIESNISRQLAEARIQLARLEREIQSIRDRLPKKLDRSTLILIISTISLLSFLALYNFSSMFRRGVIAGQRCGRIGWAVLLCIKDYKVLFRETDHLAGTTIRHDAYSDCHRRCAERIRDVLKKNGGIYIKLGQHLGALAMIPVEWSSTMKPLQDQCFPTPLEGIAALFLKDAGAPLTTFFSTFDPNPIGVASLAQVHIATERDTGKKCAVKVMHPDLEEFCAVDMQTTVFLLDIVKSVFPTFEFSWLGQEMLINLPLEMDFRHEAANAARCESDFSELASTTIYIPKVLWSRQRVLVMEYIEGSRIDDLEYLARHSIDRNLVSQELCKLFSRMIYIKGFFHADPHLGNLLIRPTQPNSRSQKNFEIVLLDHGLYFDMESSLRINYSKLWLSLIAPSSPTIELERRKYAFAAGNIDDSLYPLFQAAITGRIALETAGKGGMMEMGKQTREEEKMLRGAIVGTDGMVLAIFDLLRRVPRRMLMVLKVNDLTRALDASLFTTHGPARCFLIVAQYCNLAIYLDDLNQLPKINFSSLSSMRQNILPRLSVWWRYSGWAWSLSLAEFTADRFADFENLKKFLMEGQAGLDGLVAREALAKLEAKRLESVIA